MSGDFRICADQALIRWTLVGTALWLSACGSLAAALPPVAPPVSPADVPGVYEGSIGDQYAVRLQLGETEDAGFWGRYYYLSHGQLIPLRAELTDSLTVRELGAGPEQPPTAIFRLAPTADHGWAGTWQTADGKRHLPVRLHRYHGATPGDCPVRVRRLTYLTWFWVPRVEVADSAVNRRLRELLTLEQAAQEPPERLQEMGAPPDPAKASLEATSYTVLYQRNCLLSLKQYRSWLNVASNAVDYLLLDLRTGFPVELREEIRPEQRRAFIMACDQRLHRQVDSLLRGPERNLFAGEARQLRRRYFTADDLAVGTAVLQPQAVELIYQVQFLNGSSFLQKEFGNVPLRFTFAELQPYLRPDSPLRRLVPAAPLR